MNRFMKITGRDGRRVKPVLNYTPLKNTAADSRYESLFLEDMFVSPKQNDMKLTITILILSFFSGSFVSAGSHSPNGDGDSASTGTIKKIYVRIYDLASRRIGEGHLLYGTDSTIVVQRMQTKHSFPVSRVLFIKTRHNMASSVLIGTGAGVGLAAIGFAIAYQQTKNEPEKHDWLGAGFDTLIGSLFLPPAGALAGTVAGVSRSRRKFLINGQVDNWKQAKKVMLLN